MSVAAGLLKKASLEHLTTVFAANGIEKVMHVRNLFKDDAKFQALVPNEADRRKLLASVVDRERKETTATGIPQNDFAAGLGARSSIPVCREFVAGRCKFGATCRYSHDTPGAPANGSQDPWGPAPEARAARDSYVEEAMIPVDMLKFLLKDKAAKLVEINKKFGVSNTRIERESLTAAVDSISMPIRGPTKEAVQAAIKAIHHVVGIESQLLRESRFQYASHELRFNRQSVEYLLAANVKNQGTPLALSPATLAKTVETFRFQGPAKVHHFLMVTGPNDKDKFDAIAPLLKKFDKGLQAILFTTLDRTLEMEKRHQLSKGVFPGVTPIFAHREQPKEMRLQNFDLFKAGATNEHGVKQRLLITSDDFAKYAHKVEIPFANFIIQFCVRPKEFYALQAQCAGRRGKPGVSLTFATTSEIEAIKDLEKDVELHHLNDGKEATMAHFTKCVSELVYDTEAAPLTQATDYPPATWKEDLDKEKSAGHVRQEPPKRKPKGKKEKKERA